MSSASLHVVECVCQPVLSRGWVQHYRGMTVRLSAHVFVVFSPIPEMPSLLHWKEERREGVPVEIVAPG